MKLIYLVRALLVIIATCAVLIATGCSKKEDAPGPQVPHVAGQWAGNGTDDAIGYYNWSVTLVQSNSSAAGSFNTAGGYGTTSGDIRIDFGTEGPGNVRALTLTRTGGTLCTGSATLSGTATLSSSGLTFGYVVTDCRGTNYGGANLHKIAGTN